MVEKQNKRKILKKLKNRYRLFIINETNFQEKTSVSLTPFNVLLIASVGLIVFFLISWGIFALFPSVKNYSPGFSQGFDGKQKNEVIKKISILEENIEISKKRELALKQIINGEEITAYDIPFKEDKSRDVELSINETKADGDRVNNADALINKIKKEEASVSNQKTPNVNIEIEQNFEPMSSVLFFSPVKGTLLNEFNPRLTAYLEIAPNADESVKTIADGTIISRNWTPDFGYVITIQHANNWISVYKFNLAVYKDIGDYVSSGETIGIVGFKDKKTDSKKLRFELWKNGVSVNPKNFIIF